MGYKPQPKNVPSWKRAIRVREMGIRSGSIVRYKKDIEQDSSKVASGEVEEVTYCALIKLKGKVKLILPTRIFCVESPPESAE